MPRYHNKGVKGLVQYTAEEEVEADAAEAAWAAGATQRNAQAEIARLESEITNRRLRDAVLTPAGKTWMENQETLIAAERAKL